MLQWLEFWELIGLGKEDPDALNSRIARFSEADLVEFYWIYEEAAADLKDEEFTEHLTCPRTEDYVDDIAQWVVAQGLDYYESIMTDPSKIPAELPPGAVPPPWTGAASEFYRERYGTPVRFREDPPPRNS
ncbi:DUF4240 domain-containing protein [Streptomyces sp. NBC_01511]|uniref:DUF4240 domain-containing protein n=1 Tax=unclassified Streptomyces TaxID=2593676 RepID=UPI003863026C